MLPISDSPLNYPVILAEGAVVERLRRDSAVILDPFLLHAPLILDSILRLPLEFIYRQYMEIGRVYALPLLVFTPTWRANPERCQMANRSCSELNTTAVRFLGELRQQYELWAGQMPIGGLIGCRGDAYRPEEALGTDAASDWHSPQIEALMKGGADFLFAATLPAASEALGIARAMAAFAAPYMLSFIIQSNGCLLDGTPLENVIHKIDDEVSPVPISYLVNCVHHSIFGQAMKALERRGVPPPFRLAGLQANTSAKNPEELEGLAELDCEDPRSFAEGMLQLHREYGLRILGGCCGTDDRHIREMGRLLAESTKSREMFSRSGPE